MTKREAFVMMTGLNVEWRDLFGELDEAASLRLQ